MRWMWQGCRRSSDIGDKKYGKSRGDEEEIEIGKWLRFASRTHYGVFAWFCVENM